MKAYNLKTKDGVFNKVTVHLLTQWEVAQDQKGRCTYRLDTPKDTLKCAVGCLIKDEYYNINLEQAYCDAPLVREALRKSGVDLEETLDLLEKLQNIHDSFNKKRWPDLLEEVASDFSITIYSNTKDLLEKRKKQKE